MAGRRQPYVDRPSGDIPFRPTETSRQNLLRENIADSRITVTGNTVIDALFWVRDRVLGDEALRETLLQRYPFISHGKR
nr:UDP-N-acetylglucosamine 2-epimerase [Klebsiella pneumoniae]